MFRVGVLVTTLFVAVSAGARAATPPAIEASAARLLAAAIANLNANPAYSFDADIVYDDVQPNGLKYAVRATAQFAVQRPGQFSVKYTGDRRSATFLSNGSTFAFFDRSTHVYATSPATNGIDATLDRIAAAYDFTVPLADFVADRPGTAFVRDAQAGYVLGPSAFGTVTAHHLLFTGANIDWELWVESGAEPLIRAVAITYKKLPAQPRYYARLDNWQFGPIDPATFTFVPPAGAVRAKFAAVSTAGGAK